MTLPVEFLLNLFLSVAETLILLWMNHAFLKHNHRFIHGYALGLLSYFLFQLITYIYQCANVQCLGLLSALSCGH